MDPKGVGTSKFAPSLDLRFEISYVLLTLVESVNTKLYSDFNWAHRKWTVELNPIINRGVRILVQIPELSKQIDAF